MNRPSKYRKTDALRQFNQSVFLHESQLILPLFISELIADPTEIPSLPGVRQWPVSQLDLILREAVSAGIRAVILFGIPQQKDGVGTGASNSDGAVQQAIRLIKSAFPELVVMADCCLCEYTDHGHCGVMKSGAFDIKATQKRLQLIAQSYAEAGVDIVAPSGKIDGGVAAIRRQLDDLEFHDIGIMSYAVKFASSFYGPFRDAAGSQQEFQGDRRHHQLPFDQHTQALNEAESDINDGADYIIVKPAQAYQDYIVQLSQTQQVPIVAYQVSGEYAAIKWGASHGTFDENDAFYELYLGLIRSGASHIITYHALEMAKWLAQR